MSFRTIFNMSFRAKRRSNYVISSEAAFPIMSFRPNERSECVEKSPAVLLPLKIREMFRLRLVLLASAQHDKLEANRHSNCHFAPPAASVCRPRAVRARRAQSQTVVSNMSFRVK